MKKTGTILWGIALVAIGLIWALNVFNIIHINIFFDGWWTLFIIVPCAIGLFTEHEKTGNIIGIVIGVFLLLCCQDVLNFSMLWKLLVPTIIVIIGIKMVLSGVLGSKTNDIIKKLRAEGKEPKTGSATFSGCNLNYDSEVFEGAELSAVFGSVDCNLKNAIIENDCVIQATAVFGGIDILVPDNVNVKVNSNSIFGGMSNRVAGHKEGPTIYVSGTCLFGGVEIK